MPTILIRHRIANAATWELVFEEHRVSRAAHGSFGGRVFRHVDDPDEVFVLLEWDDIDRARLYIRSDELSQVMVEGGVIDRPDIWLLEEEAGGT